jgi:hypothetical protein
VLVLENHEYGDVMGNGSAPYINHLAHRFSLSRQSFAVSHPSLPNYLALLGGSTFGIHSDCDRCSVSKPSLVDQLVAKHISWKAYMQGMPSPCFQGGASGKYVKNHDPFMYFRRIAGNPGRCRNVVPFTQYRADRGAGRLPRFVWISPDRCQDGHDCSLSTTDHFLHRIVPGLLRSLGSNGLLFLTWDEGTSGNGCCSRAAGGHVVTIVAGPGARRNAASSVPYDHYSILRTIEDLWGLNLLRGAGCGCTTSMYDLLQT